MSTKRKLAVALGVTALAIPAAAMGHHKEGHDKGGKGHGKTHAVKYIFKGTYVGDGSTVSVHKGNAHARRADLTGVDVAFDFSSARIVVADTNADEAKDLSDVVAGDRVVVHARLPKGDPGAQPIAAKKLIDQTNNPADEDEGEVVEEGDGGSEEGSGVE